MATTVIREKTFMKDWCGASYQSSIATIHLLRDSVEILPIDRGRVSLPGHFPWTTDCEDLVKEKQVIAVYPADAFAPLANGSWPKVTVDAFDDKKGAWRSLSVDPKILKSLWRDVSSTAAKR